jgi:hypothetical protein
VYVPDPMAGIRLFQYVPDPRASIFQCVQPSRKLPYQKNSCRHSLNCENGRMNLLYGACFKFPCKQRSSIMFLKHWKKNNLNFVNIEVKSAHGQGKVKILLKLNKLKYCPFPGVEHQVIKIVAS